MNNEPNVAIPGGGPTQPGEGVEHADPAYPTPGSPDPAYRGPAAANADADAGTSSPLDASSPSSSPSSSSDPRTDAHASTLETHAETLGQHGDRFDELERHVDERLDAIEAKLADRFDRGLAAQSPEQLGSTAADPETGLQAGHAGPGTGDGPAGR